MIKGDTAMENGADKVKLAVLWKTANRETVANVVLPYVKAAGASGRFGHVRLAAWGPSVRVMSGYGDIGQRVAELAQSGVEVTADSLCAELYGAAEAMELTGAHLTDMSAALTDMILGGWQIITM